MEIRDYVTIDTLVIGDKRYMNESNLGRYAGEGRQRARVR